MSKSAIVLGFFIHAMANQPAIADETPSTNSYTEVTTLEEVCTLNKNTPYFDHHGFTYDNSQRAYRRHCGHISYSRTGPISKSSLEIKAHGHHKDQWEYVTLTLNIDDNDDPLFAYAAFREVSYKLLVGQIKEPKDRPLAYALAYGDEYFDNIESGQYAKGVDFLQKDYQASMTHQYNRRGGDKIILVVKRL